ETRGNRARGDKQSWWRFPQPYRFGADALTAGPRDARREGKRRPVRVVGGTRRRARYRRRDEAPAQSAGHAFARRVGQRRAVERRIEQRTQENLRSHAPV